MLLLLLCGLLFNVWDGRSEKGMRNREDCGRGGGVEGWGGWGGTGEGRDMFKVLWELFVYILS